jgi:uncharacterized membrane protein HdeD (DUF308 family)
MMWQPMQVQQASQTVRRVWPLLVVRGALMAVFGLITLLWPALTAVVLIALFGAYAVLDGVITLGYGLRRRRSRSGGNGWLLQGGIAVAAGLVALFWPAASAAVVLIVLGFWALLIGVVVMAIGLQLRRARFGFWWAPLVLGALGVVFGLVMIFQPAEAMVALASVLGVLTLLGGVLLVLGGLRLRALRLT